MLAVGDGLTVNGLGQVSILVPRELADKASLTIEPQKTRPAE